MAKQGKKLVVVASSYYNADKVQISEDDDIATAYREMFDDLSDTETTATDDEIIVAVKSVPGDGSNDDVQQKRLDAIGDLSSVDDELTTADVKDEGRRVASVIGKEMPNDVQQFLVGLADKTEDVATGPLVLADMLDQTMQEGGFGYRLARLPYPNTHFDPKVWAKSPKRNPGNEKPDYYSRDVVGFEKPIKGSEYQDVWDNSPAGSFILDVLKLIDRASKDKNAMLDTDEATWNKLVDENPWENLFHAEHRKSIKARWRKRSTGGAQRLRVAEAYRRQVAAIESAVSSYQTAPCMTVGWVHDDIKVARRKLSPILIAFQAPGQKLPALSDPKSIGTFVRYDVAKARELAEAAKVPVQISHLTATIKKAPRQTQQPKVFEVASPTADEAQTMIKSLRNFFNTKKARVDLAKAFASDIGAADVIVYGDMLEEATSFFDQFSDQYAAMKAKDEATKTRRAKLAEAFKNKT